jgi:hypothetical protein
MHKTTIISAILCLPSLIIALPAAAPNEIVRRSGTSVATVLSNLSVMKPTLNCLSTLTAQNSSLSSRDENSTANTAASGSTNTASSMDHSTHHDDKTSNGYTIPTALTTLQGQVDNTTTAVMGCSTFNAADSSMVMGGLDDVVPGFRSFLTNLMVHPSTSPSPNPNTTITRNATPPKFWPHSFPTSNT